MMRDDSLCVLGVASTAQAWAQCLPGVKRHQFSPAFVESPLVDLTEGKATPSRKFFHTLFMTQPHLVIEVMLTANIPTVGDTALVPVLSVILLEHS